MADTERTTILNVEVNNKAALKAMVEYQKSIEETKAAEKALKEAMKKGGTDEQRQELAKLQQQRSAYNKALQTTAREIQNNIREQNAADGSLNRLRAELSRLTAQYDALSEKARDGEFGEGLKDQINTITKSLKKGEEGTQRFQRNVGNYKQDFLDAFSAVGGSAGAIVAPLQNVNKAMLVLKANPLFSIIALFAYVLGEVIKSLKSSEENVNAAAAAFSGFSVITDLLAKGLQYLGKGLAKLGELFSNLLKRVGAYTEEMERAEEITRSTANLNKLVREYEEENAKAAVRVSELRNKAKDKENATAAERLAAIQEAARIEEEVVRRNLELANERLRIAELEAERTENDKETNDNLSRLRVEVLKAQETYNNRVRELLEQENTLRNEIEAENKARLEAERKRLEEEAKLQEEVIDLEISLMEEGEEKMLRQEEERHRRRIEEIQRRLEEESDLTEGARNALYRQLELEDELHQQNLVNIEAAGVAAREATRLEEIAEQKRLDEEAMEEQRLKWSNMLAEAELNGENTLQLKLDIAKAELEALHQYEGESDEEFRARQLEAEKNYYDAKDALVEQHVANQKAQAQATGSILGSIGDLFTAFGEDNKAAAVAAKVLGIAQIMVDTAVGIAEAVKAGSGVPFPGNLPAIAMGVATVVANTTAAMKMIKGSNTGGGDGGASAATASLSSASTGAALAAAASVAQNIPQVQSSAAEKTYEQEAIVSAVERGVKGVKIVASWEEGQAVGKRIEFLEDLGSV